jgi:hypothetical protein
MKTLKYMIAILLTTSLLSCGVNVFQPAAESDPETDAVLAMEKNKPDEAIAILEKALEDDPDNPKLLSLLGSATAQKYGFDPLSFALDLAKQQSESSSTEESETTESSSSNGITTMFSALPTASQKNIDGIAEAIAFIESIPSADRSKADNFKLSMLHTAKMAMVTKQFSEMVQGDFSAENLQNLTPDQAIQILSSLSSAAIAMAAASASADGNSGKAAEQISAIQSKIDEQEGATQEEKLRNYLAKQEATSAAQQTTTP